MSRPASSKDDRQSLMAFFRLIGATNASSSCRTMVSVAELILLLPPN